MVRLVGALHSRACWGLCHRHLEKVLQDVRNTMLQKELLNLCKLDGSALPYFFVTVFSSIDFSMAM